MQRTPVDSSMMASVGYDAASRTLEIEFRSGRVYQYFDVPRRIHRELMKAESHGCYFNDEIRDEYTYSQVTPRRRSFARAW
jgi:hypothetical protein